MAPGPAPGARAARPRSPARPPGPGSTRRRSRSVGGALEAVDEPSTPTPARPAGAQRGVPRSSRTRALTRPREAHVREGDRRRAGRPRGRPAGAIWKPPPKTRALATITISMSCRPRGRPSASASRREAAERAELAQRAVQVEQAPLEVARRSRSPRAPPRRSRSRRCSGSSLSSIRPTSIVAACAVEHDPAAGRDVAGRDPERLGEVAAGAARHEAQLRRRPRSGGSRCRRCSRCRRRPPPRSRRKPRSIASRASRASSPGPWVRRVLDARSAGGEAPRAPASTKLGAPALAGVRVEDDEDRSSTRLGATACCRRGYEPARSGSKSW